MNYYDYDYGYLRFGHRSHLRTYGLKVVTEAATEPVTLTQARLHLRLDSYGSPPEHADDQWITDNISTAREWCEFYSGRALAPQVLELALPNFPHAWYGSYWSDDLKLPFGPIAGVESVTYLDPTTGLDVVVDTAAYTVDVSQDIGYVYPLINTCWPVTLCDRANAVRVRYHAGYTSDADSPNDMPLPKRYRSAILLVLGHLYENRENSTELKLETLPLSAGSLMDGTRLRMGFA